MLFLGSYSTTLVNIFEHSVFVWFEMIAENVLTVPLKLQTPLHLFKSGGRGVISSLLLLLESYRTTLVNIVRVILFLFKVGACYKILTFTFRCP